MKKALYLDATKPIEKRVNDLLARMTIDEKINQMYSWGYNQVENLVKRIENGEELDISCTFVYKDFDVEAFNKLQKYQIEKSRLKIPVLLASENLHGVSNPLCTVFPTSGCISATFDEKLAGKVADESAKEARILGIRQVYAPNVDISWDLRWGRVEENYGEDPYLASKMAVEVVKNIQKNQVASTVKHYIAYGLGESGINLAPAHIGERDIREYMLPPFEACIKKGKVWSVMPSYNEIDGEPVHASKRWMQDILRDELKFDGMVITDYEASNMLKSFQHIIDEPVEAGKILCANQVDMEASEYFGYNAQFRELVKSGKFPISKVNQCVKNILRMKFRLGLFENPYAQLNKMDKLHSKKAVALAKEVANKGIVLLKNDGVLPLTQDKKVALIGPNADIAQLGNYVYYQYFNKNYHGKVIAEEALTLKQVFEQENISFVYEQGADFAKTDEEMLHRAYDTAMQSDVVVLAVGDNGKGGNCAGSQEDLKRLGVSKVAVTTGEGYDLNSIELTPAQEQLFDKVAQAGKPIVLLVYGGRPHAITRQVERSSAILMPFFAGEQGNQALVDILYGKVNPSGKLPISVPRSTGHLPCFYNHKPTARGSYYKLPGSYDAPGKDYVFDTPKALYPFGYGLSYTQFQYDNLRVERVGRYAFSVKVNVTNIGDMDGDESVLVFLSQKTQRITPMVKKLRAFKRISLKKGESKEVCFTLRKEDFSFVDVDMKRRVANGECKVRVGDLEETICIE